MVKKNGRLPARQRRVGCVWRLTLLRSTRRSLTLAVENIRGCSYAFHPFGNHRGLTRGGGRLSTEREASGEPVEEMRMWRRQQTSQISRNTLGGDLWTGSQSLPSPRPVFSTGTCSGVVTDYLKVQKITTNTMLDRCVWKGEGGM
ncbi:hypothetical protein Bbelb_195370 [Branchiostoma belcheri]|nr:hypothetical protein Bbelb_195370 [Branchiostoma belcheri]